MNIIGAILAQEYELQTNTIENDIARIVLVILTIGLLWNAVRLAYAKSSNSKRDAIVSVGLAVVAIIIAIDPSRVVDMIEALFNRWTQGD